MAHYRVVPQGFMWLNWCCGPSIIVSPLLFLLFMVSSSFSLLFDYWENFSLSRGGFLLTKVIVGFLVGLLHMQLDDWVVACLFR